MHMDKQILQETKPIQPERKQTLLTLKPILRMVLQTMLYYRNGGTKCFILSDTNGINKIGSISQIYGLNTAKRLQY